MAHDTKKNGILSQCSDGLTTDRVGPAALGREQPQAMNRTLKNIFDVEGSKLASDNPLAAAARQQTEDPNRTWLDYFGNKRTGGALERATVAAIEREQTLTMNLMLYGLLDAKRSKLALERAVASKADREQTLAANKLLRDFADARRAERAPALAAAAAA
ncbi:MAG: hypothetical protein H7338_14925, partial [Candidatus Sericytochromatia bacterium]|nr:hypothetical protein [Candidatus Sericytochromatia bacterium]